MVEFELRGDLAKVQNAVIDANFDEVKRWINGQLAAYRTLIVTEDGVTQAKSYRAQIRKIAGHIDEQRKAAKRAYMAPLTAFEDKCKELTGLCTEASDALDAQIKGYEEARRKERENKLKAVFDGLASDLVSSGMVKWENIFEPAWCNTSTSETKALAAVQEAIDTIRSDMDAISSLGSPHEAALLSHYARTHDLPATLKLNAEYLRRDEELKAERERKAKLETVPRPASDCGAHEIISTEPTPVSFVTVHSEPELIFYTDFRVWCTETQLFELGSWMKAHNIKYGRVPEKEEESN